MQEDVEEMAGEGRLAAIFGATNGGHRRRGGACNGFRRLRPPRRYEYFRVRRRHRGAVLCRFHHLASHALGFYLRIGAEDGNGNG